jgi:hypothetical protein
MKTKPSIWTIILIVLSVISILMIFSFKSVYNGINTDFEKQSDVVDKMMENCSIANFNNDLATYADCQREDDMWSAYLTSRAVASDKIFTIEMTALVLVLLSILSWRIDLKKKA